MHRVVLNRDFLFKRRGISTDSLYSIVIGLTANIWMIATVLSEEHSDNASPNASSVLGQAA